MNLEHVFAAILRALARASGLSEKQRASFEEILPGLNPPGPLLLSLTKSVPEQLLVDTADGQPGEDALARETRLAGTLPPQTSSWSELLRVHSLRRWK